MKKLLVLTSLATLPALVILGGTTIAAGSTDCSVAFPLPFIEDFTGLATGDIPAGWERTHENWGAADSNNAGGIQPEMYMDGRPAQGNQIKLITPKLDGAGAAHIMCTFKHFFELWTGSINFLVQTSTDNGATWQDRWSQTYTADFGGDVVVNLNAVSDEEFQVAFVFEGDLSNMAGLYIDDVTVCESLELDMLDPDGQGAVSPQIGQHNALEGQQITLGAIPSSTWYGFNRPSGYDGSIVLDPMNPANTLILGPNIASNYVAGGTWADGTWFVSNYDPLNNSRLWKVDPVDGTMTEIGQTGANIIGLAYDEMNDILYGSSKTSLYKISKSSGSALYIGDYFQGNSLEIEDIAYGNGVLCGHSAAMKSIYTIDVNTAETTFMVQPFTFDTNYKVHGMEYDKDHDRLFLSLSIQQATWVSYLAEVDLITGKALFYGSFSSGDEFELNRISALAIPYGIDHPWIFDHWEIDGALYSNDPLTTLTIDTDHAVQAFFNSDATIICSPGDLFALAVNADEAGACSDAYYGYISADDFTCLTEPITGIDFWGAEYDLGASSPCTKSSLEYIIRFYELDPLPENLAHEETITVTRVVSTKYFLNDPDNGPVYKYTGTLAAPVTMSGGWFSVQAIAGGPCAFLWVDAGLVTGSTDFEYAQYDDEWDYAGDGCNLAFCLLGGEPPEPTATPTATNTPEPTSTQPPDPTPTEPPEPTPTAPPEPTATEPPEPTATEPPEPTPTEPSEPTPTEPPEPTPTEPPEPTSTEPPEPTSTETPEPTPSYPLGVRLDMPDMAHPGDEFFIIGFLDNPDAPLTHVATFFILEVYGKFWFWPSWVYFDYPDYQDIDYKSLDVPTGTTNVTVIPPFYWPDTGQDVLTDLRLYGAMLNSEMNDIMGGFAVKEWGYGPKN